VRFSETLVGPLPSTPTVLRPQWKRRGFRFNLLLQDLRQYELAVAVPSPSWDWASRILLIFWLLTQPKSDTKTPMICDFQRWGWDVDAEEFVPRSYAQQAFTHWPDMLAAVRLALRVARKLGDADRMRPTEQQVIATPPTDDRGDPPAVRRAPTDGDEVPATAPIQHADDFTWLTTHGRQFAFKAGNQARVIEILFESWESSGRHDGSGLSQAAIAEKLSAAPSFRMRTLFRGNAALDAILRSGSKGVWALHLDEPTKA
jgi:hypothetical protein